jgi:hypothetical protein
MKNNDEEIRKIQQRILNLKSKILQIKNNVYSYNTEKILKRENFISVNDISVYENYIKIEERKLMDLNPIFSDDINVLKEIRNKYIAIERIKEFANIFNNYDELLGFLQLTNEEIDNKIRLLDKRISDLVRNQ